MKNPNVVIEIIKMIGYVLAAAIPAYFSYRVIVKRMPFRKRGNDGSAE